MDPGKVANGTCVTSCPSDLESNPAKLSFPVLETLIAQGLDGRHYTTLLEYLSTQATVYRYHKP